MMRQSFRLKRQKYFFVRAYFLKLDDECNMCIQLVKSVKRNEFMVNFMIGYVTNHSLQLNVDTMSSVLCIC